MHLLLANGAGANTTQLIISVFGATGALGALAAWFKLRGEKDSLAVSQAQGAMEVMETLQSELKDTLARAEADRDFYKARADQFEHELSEYERLWGPLPQTSKEIKP